MLSAFVKTFNDEKIAVMDRRLYIARVRYASGHIQPGLDGEGSYMIPPLRFTIKEHPGSGRTEITLLALLVMFVLLLATRASGHAILVRSTPKANEVVTSGDLKFELEFNARVDAARSSLLLVLPSGETEKLEVLSQPSPAVLAAKAVRLAPGAYSIRWQVLTNDGHITRGEVPFKVK